jgi:hypothetical protein
VLPELILHAREPIRAQALHVGLALVLRERHARRAAGEGVYVALGFVSKMEPVFPTKFVSDPISWWAS